MKCLSCIMSHFMQSFLHSWRIIFGTCCRLTEMNSKEFLEHHAAMVAGKQIPEESLGIDADAVHA